MKKGRIFRILVCIVIIVLANRKFDAFWLGHTEWVMSRAYQAVVLAIEGTDRPIADIEAFAKLDNAYNSKGEVSHGPFAVPVVFYPHAVMEGITEERAAFYQGEEEFPNDISMLWLYEGDCFVDIFHDNKGFLGTDAFYEVAEIVKTKYPIYSDWNGLPDQGSYFITEYYLQNGFIVPVTVARTENDETSIVWETSDSLEGKTILQSDKLEICIGVKTLEKGSLFYERVRDSLEYEKRLSDYSQYYLIDFPDDTPFRAISERLVTTKGYYAVYGDGVRGVVSFAVISTLFGIAVLLVLEYGYGRFEKYVYNKYFKLGYEMTVINALAHDIKSSLMVIGGSAENLLAGTDEEMEKVFREQMSSEIGKMEALTEKMQQFQNSTELRDIEKTAVNMTSVIADVIARYEAAAAERGLTFAVQTEGNLVLQAEHDLMDMVIDNFLYNAVKYAVENTEIRITVSEQQFTVTNQWEPVEGYIRRPERFFKSFEVGGKERSSKKGSGVGLAIAANILTYFEIHYRAAASEKEVRFEIFR